MLKAFGRELVASFKAWSKDHAAVLAAALSFFLAFSMAPLLLVAVAIAGLAFGQAAAQGAVASALTGYVGPEAAALIQRVMAGLNRPGANLAASVAGLAGLLLGASGIFIQVQIALNLIFKSRAARSGLVATLWNRMLAFGIMAGTGLLLLAFLIAETMLARLTGYITALLPGIGWLLQPASLLLSVLVFTVAFAGLFEFLPAARVAWRDAWRGGLLTSALFTLGNALIALYMGHSGTASLYGAASSLFLLLLWMYYSAQIFLFGAEFTHVHARRGESLQPAQPQKWAAEPYHPWAVAGSLALGGFLLGRHFQRSRR